ncbi:FAD dependent oxidoreductase [Mariannaea sp. PMI_226]|nr:FAD dependent oxidoreductase [Mariannaea sp. PMI_226]
MASNTSGRLPVADPVTSFWNADPKKLDDYRSTAQLPSTADIVIIGSGLSGVATAYYLLKDNPNPPSIVLLEARKICSGATGRNGGHVKPDTYSDIPKFAKLFGIKAAAHLADFEASHVFAVKDLVEKEGLECDFHITRALDVYLDPAHAKKVETTYKEIAKSGTVNLADVAFTPKQHAERISGVKNAQACISYTAAHLWPSKLVHQLLQKLVDQGLNVQAHTPVTSVSPASGGDGSWTITTPRGNIETKKVIHATNAYASHILPEYSHAITPVRGVCSHLESTKREKTPHLVNTYGIRFDEVNNDYLIPRADGSVIVGGARQAFWHNKERYFGTVRDDELVSEATPYFDNYMQRHFRGWEKSDMKTKKVWTGILGYSLDFMPHIGEVPGKRGQFIIAGFTGYGMPKILLSSKGLAAMVRDGVSFEETGLPMPFKTTEQRNESSSSPLEDSIRALWTGKAKL